MTRQTPQPSVDYSNIIDQAQDALDETFIDHIVTQVSSQGIVTPQLSESKIEVNRDQAREGPILWASIYLALEYLTEIEYIEWINVLDGSVQCPSFDNFEHYFQYNRVVGGPSNPLTKVYPYLTEDGMDTYWSDMYRAYARSRPDRAFDASTYRRCLALARDRASNPLIDSSELDRAARFAILLVEGGTGVSTIADFIVNQLLDEEDRDYLHRHEYIVRVGSSTHKIYPYDKATKAITSFHATPTLLDEYGDLMWRLYRRESVQSGVRKSFDIDSKESYRQAFLDDWNQTTRHGVQS